MQAYQTVPNRSLNWPDLDVFSQSSKSSWMAPRSISGSVFLAHLLLLWLMTFNWSFQQTKKPAQKLIVHTVSLQSAGSAALRQMAAPPNRQELPAAIAPSAPPPPAAVQEPVEVEEQAVEVLEEKAAPIPEPEPVVEPKPEPKPAPKPVAKPATKPVAKKPPAKPEPKKPEPKPAVKPKPKPVAKPVPKTAPKPDSKPDSKPTAKKADDKALEAKRAKEAAAKKEAQAKEAAAKAAKEKAAREAAAKEAAQAAKVNEALSSLNAASQKGTQKSSLQASSSKISGSAPVAISSLASDSLVSINSDPGESMNARERTYYDELVSRLKLSLKMPEFGEVKLQLSISRDGKVLGVSNIKSKSKKNSDYIQKMVPKINFPPFGQNFSGEKEHTFRLTLSNELNY